MNRRTFLALGSAFPYHLFANDTRKHATDRIKLGPMGVEVSRLAQGSGTNGSGGSSNQTKKLGVQGLADLYRAAYAQGVTFFDTADQYGTHPHVKLALQGLPREKVALMTKTAASTAKEMRADLDRYRKELGTDYIDIVLLHCMIDDDWPERKKGAMEVLSEAREKGIIRTHGTSCHTLGALKAAAKNPWVQVDLARINPAQAHMDADPATVLGVLKEMKAAGKGVIGMKILGAGKLRGNVDQALQFALAQEVVDAFTIGAESRTEMEDLLCKIPAASVRG
jgi:aryl-alcohol dehydrogenase-like predicted oxidoreductase